MTRATIILTMLSLLLAGCGRTPLAPTETAPAALKSLPSGALTGS